MFFEKNGVRSIDFLLTASAIRKINKKWKKFADEIKDYETNFNDKGIVICAGGLEHLTCAWVNIKMIRRSGCQLPVEVWYLGNEISVKMLNEISSLNVVCKNFLDYGDYNIAGFSLKPLAIFLSSFKEVLFLDSDNVCTKNPDYLFDNQDYKTYGSMFWPDFWKTSEDNPIWEIVECNDYQVPEQESGQILVNKEKCWKELNLCLYFNLNNNVYHKFLYGDKDTFKFAWSALKTPYFMIQKSPGICGYHDDDGLFLGHTIVQHDPDGEILFLHRNLLKWNVTLPEEKVWEKIKIFNSISDQSEFLLGYSKRSHMYMDFAGDVDQLDVKELFFSELENECLIVLSDLIQQQFYSDFMKYSHMREKRFNSPKAVFGF